MHACVQPMFKAVTGEAMSLRQDSLRHTWPAGGMDSEVQKRGSQGKLQDPNEQYEDHLNYVLELSDIVEKSHPSMYNVATPCM